MLSLNLGARIAAWRERAQARREFELLAAEDKLGRLLADIGLSPAQVPVVLKNGGSVRRHLEPMLARLGLTPRQASRAVGLRELGWRCMLCRSRDACRTWLARETRADAPPAFCPNAADLQKIKSRDVA